MRFGPASRWALLLIELLLCTPRIYAQRPVHFDHLLVEHGLSHNSVMSFVQDQEGFLWFGTQDGLNRYDGYGFTVFQNDPQDATTLSDNFVTDLALDPSGDIWVGTARGGLNRLDTQTNRFVRYQHDAQDPGSLSDNLVLSVHVARDSTVWVGTTKGINRWDVTTERFKRYRHRPGDPTSLSNDHVYAIHESRDGILWVGTQNGLNRLDPEQDTFTTFLHDPGDPHSLSHNVVRTIREDQKGRLWIGTFGGGLNLMDRVQESFISFQHHPSETRSISSNEIRTLFEDSHGMLWVGTYNGLNRFDTHTFQAERYLSKTGEPSAIPHNFIYTIGEDRSGVLWIGTLEGIARLRVHQALKPASTSFNYSQLSDLTVTALALDHTGDLWVGSLGKGLVHLHANGDITHFRHDEADPFGLGNDRISSLLVNQRGRLWVGTYGAGLHLFDSKTGNFVKYQHDPGDPYSLSHNNVNSIYEDHSGTLWISTHGGGLNRFDEAHGYFIAYRHNPADTTSIGSDATWPIFEDDQGALWIGTAGGGLSRLGPERTVFRTYHHLPANTNSLSSDVVFAITQDSKGRLWVGTKDGLNLFDPVTQQFKRCTAQDGLPHPTIAGIIPDDRGFLWISTIHGLARYNPDQDQFTTFYLEDGLPSNTFHVDAHAKSDDGTLFLGTSRGLMAFNPYDLDLSTPPPPVALTSLLLFNEPIRLDTSASAITTITWPHDQNFIAFEFAVLDYRLPAQNQYRYMLEGLDKTWVEAGPRRHAEYPNLAPGSYTFRVRGANSQGVWNMAGSSLRLTILPPFWQTWPFRLLVLGTVIGLITAMYQYRVRQLRHLHRTRQRIADDLHDDIGSKISNIALRMDIAGRNPALDTMVRGQLADLALSARTVVDELRDAIWMVDSTNDRLESLASRMELTLAQLAVGRHCSFSTKPNPLPDVVLTLDQRRHLYLWYKEAIHNAVQHGAPQHIDIYLQVIKDRLSLRIRDDGIGFEVEHVEEGRGFATLCRRAEALKGSMHLKSTPGEGTELELIAPIRR